MNRIVQIAVLPAIEQYSQNVIVALDERGKAWINRYGGSWEALPLLPEDKCSLGTYCSFPSGHDGACTTTKG